ncbi:MAG: flagellar biosynthesis anti-sigma factor FlgM [Armatimonadota bacterium]
MRIDPKDVSRIGRGRVEPTEPTGAEEVGPQQAPEAPSREGEVDRVVLSAKAREVQAARELIRDPAPVRADKVAQLRHMIESQEYDVEATELAADMLRHPRPG